MGSQRDYGKGEKGRERVQRERREELAREVTELCNARGTMHSIKFKSAAPPSEEKTRAAWKCDETLKEIINIALVLSPVRTFMEKRWKLGLQQREKVAAIHLLVTNYADLRITWRSAATNFGAG